MSDYSILRAGDAPDFLGDAPGAFLGYAGPLGSEQVGVNMRVLAPGTAHVPPGQDPARGHSHTEIDEIYLVVDGEVRIKLGDEVETLGPRDAVLIPPHVPRQMRNDSDADATVVMVSVRPGDPASEVRWHDGFWPS